MPIRNVHQSWRDCGNTRTQRTWDTREVGLGGQGCQAGSAKYSGNRAFLRLFLVGFLLVLFMALRPQGLLGNRKELLLEK